VTTSAIKAHIHVSVWIQFPGTFENLDATLYQGASYLVGVDDQGIVRVWSEQVGGYITLQYQGTMTSVSACPDGKSFDEQNCTIVMRDRNLLGSGQ
jgi:hypothetical protein